MLNNLPIRSKLAATLTFPLVAMLVFASLRVSADVRQDRYTERVNRAIVVAARVTGLVHELQRERGLSTGYIGSGRREGYADLVAQRATVDQAASAFRAQARALDVRGAPSPTGSGIERAFVNAMAQLDGIEHERQQVDQSPVTVEQVLGSYTGVIWVLVQVTTRAVETNQSQEVLAALIPLAIFSWAKEFTGEERALLNGVLSRGRFTGQEYLQLVAIIAGRDVWLAQFHGFATPAQQALLAKVMADRKVARAQQLEQLALASQRSARIGTDPREWYAVMTAKIDAMRKVEMSMTGDLLRTSNEVRDRATRSLALNLTAVLLALVLTVGCSLLTARSMVRPLRDLKDTAHDIADRRLPEVVERLHRTDRVDLDGELELAPVGIRSGDEIGQVAKAFDSVHQVAVRVAAEQAQLRKSVGDMFVNLARRSQRLVDRQLELIDDLERSEADPDALQDLFRLDHLATRMRRNAENLIVLSGAEPARRWSQPVALVDVVRAAIAEVEDYPRVELLPLDGAGVVGQAVGDVVHLLAELVENATSFSPPETKVVISGQPVASGYVIEIEDRGLGMTDTELAGANERLANPPLIDMALSRMLGFFVVGRLAQRYGIRAQLRHSWYGGVTALVVLPRTLVVRLAGPETGPIDLTARSKRVRPALASPSATTGPSLGLHLPIFEAARSDWFEAGRTADGLTADGGAARRAAEGNGGEAPSQGLPMPPPPPPPLKVVVAPLPAAVAAARHAPPSPPAAPAGDGGAATTQSGLPRRVPMANLAPSVADGPPAAPVVPVALRSPEEVRSMLSSYRTGFERGRYEAGSVQASSGTDPISSFGSDHDAAE